MRDLMAVLVLLLAGAPAPGAAAPTATVEMKSAEGRRVGAVTLAQTPQGVLFRASLRRLPPGAHALHVHATGRCEGPGFGSAGEPLAPAGTRPTFASTIHVPDSGAVRVAMLAPHVSLGPGRADLLDADGSALVLHAGVDDGATNAAGAAGARIACGEIEGRAPSAGRP